MTKISTVFVWGAALAGTIVLAGDGHCQADASRLGAGPEYHVLAIGGVHEDAEPRLEQNRILDRLQRVFRLELKVPEENIHVLTAYPDSDPESPMHCSAEHVAAAFARLADAVQPSACFFFYYVGQANIVNQELRLNLPGPDITHLSLASHLSQIRAATSVVVLDCPGAGMAVEAIAGPGRIGVFSCRSDQPYSTHFSDYFLPAIANSDADANGDRRISLLEAFRHASIAIDDLYRTEGYMKTENALLEDDGDGVPTQHPWLYQQEDVDGEIASKFQLWPPTR